MKCYNCGAELDNGVKFCPECGSMVSTATAAVNDPWHDEDSVLQQAEPVTKKTKSKLPLIIGVAVLALALIIGLFACGGSDNNGGGLGRDPIVGNWEGVKFLADDVELDESVRGEFSMTFNTDGTCKLIMPSLGDTPDMVYSYDSATTDSYNATKTDGSSVRIYGVSFANSPNTVIYYAMLTEDGMGLLSTDAFSTSYTYQLIFRAA